MMFANKMIDRNTGIILKILPYLKTNPTKRNLLALKTVPVPIRPFRVLGRLKTITEAMVFLSGADGQLQF